MQKRIMNTIVKKYSWIIALSVLTLGGCDSYLDENPDNRVDLNNPDKAAQLLTNAYASSGYLFTEWMTDNVRYTTGTTRLTEHDQAYHWEDVISINQDTPTDFWMSTYDAVAHANEVLAVIDGMEGEKDRKDAVKGEAYLTRAYGHFMLVNIFAKHYNTQTADDDLGIPYVTEPEKVFVKQYARLSVQEVYDKIESDILSGIRYVDASYYANSGKYHFTKNAALAFASRFYLYKGDFDKCIKYSSDMLGADPSIYIKDIQKLLEETVNPLDFLHVYGLPTDQSNLLVARNVTNFPVTVGYWPSPPLIQGLFSYHPWNAEDVRVSQKYPIFLRGSGWTLGKFEFLFERSSLTSNVGLNYTIVPLFRGEEVLLNRAESNIRKNQLTAALADLQVLLNFRYYPNPVATLAQFRNLYSTNDSQSALLQFVLHEREREFMHEGLRWFDLKRHNLEVKHDLADGTIITLAPDDKRKVIQIPQTAIDVGGLQPNPR
jgi:starch-binding outer membrane protein, SusD/RagB family